MSRAFTHTLLIGGLLLIVAIAAGLWYLATDPSGSAESEARDRFQVARGGFDITVLASGELAAAKQIEIKNKLDSRAVITEIVPEGKTVKEGEVLVRFNDEDIVNRIKDAEDSVIAAENNLASARANLEIRLKERESDLAKADLKIELADLALKSWEEGEVKSKRTDLDLRRKTAQKEHDRLVARFQASQKLLEQEFISLDEYKRDEIDMIRAAAALEQAKLDIDVYEKYTYEQERKTKVSDLEQARQERVRVEQRHDAEVARAESDVSSKERQLTSQGERLADLRLQHEYCTVRAPADGLVVYASSMERNRWGSNEAFQVGSELHRNQLVIILPDTSQMVAEVKVNEALSGLIGAGQKAFVTCDAAPDQVMSGEVINIGVLAESGGWRDPNRRDYTVRVRLDGQNSLGLKPSMRCKGEIYVGRVEDALYVPVQAVHREGPVSYVYVPQSGGFAQHQVTPGRVSELFVEVADGLSEGDTVLLRRPDTREVVSKLQIDTAVMPGGTNGGNGYGRPGRPPRTQDTADRRTDTGAEGTADAGDRAGQGAAEDRQGERRRGRRPGNVQG